MNAAQRVLRARLGGLTTAARGHVNTAPARAAFDARFYIGIPADLPPAEEDRRAAAARRESSLGPLDWSGDESNEAPAPKMTRSTPGPPNLRVDRQRE